ncbi:hypothetical protein ACRRTK_020409 [Alexandromys fortis]
MYCFSRGHGLRFPASTWQLIAICSITLVPGDPTHFFWPQQAHCMYTVHRHRYREKHRYTSKEIFKKK